MKLVIVESPAKAKTIEKYLGKEYKVCASVGHVRDLPKSNKKAIDISAGFIPHYETIPGKEKVIKEIKSLATKADEVILATDPDREGEAIAWHVAEALGLKKPKRSTFNEITKDAVNTAIAHQRGIDEKLVSAQEARRVLDRLLDMTSRDSFGKKYATVCLPFVSSLRHSVSSWNVNVRSVHSCPKRILLFQPILPTGKIQ